MIVFEKRLNRLIIEKDLSFEDFSNNFEDEYGYCFDYDDFVKECISFPSISVMVDLCKYFDCSLGYLTGSEQNMGCGIVSKIYDRYVDLYAAVLDNDGFSEDFKYSLFMDIKNRFRY